MIGMLRITEGSTVLHVNKEYFGQPRGPKEKVADTVFYNPEMALGRDVGVAFFSTLDVQKDWTVLDGLAGSGVRGLRLARESGHDFSLVLNDANERAAKLIRRNVRANKLKGVKVLNRKLETILSSERFGYIEIDPFGTPVQFLHPAAQRVEQRCYPQG